MITPGRRMREKSAATSCAGGAPQPCLDEGRRASLAYMLRRLALVLLALVSACAQSPERPEELPAPKPTPSPAVQPRETGSLIGLNGAELTTRLGRPALQIREGNSVKVQYRGSRCVLDAFLYPGARSEYRVTHVEARTLAGIDTNQEACIASLLYPS